jgi:hypothetical protein
MMGPKTLAQVRAELEEALGHQLASESPPAVIESSKARMTIWESLQRFLGKALTSAKGDVPKPSPKSAGKSPLNRRAKSRGRRRASDG